MVFRTRAKTLSLYTLFDYSSENPITGKKSVKTAWNMTNLCKKRVSKTTNVQKTTKLFKLQQVHLLMCCFIQNRTLFQKKHKGILQKLQLACRRRTVKQVERNGIHYQKISWAISWHNYLPINSPKYFEKKGGIVLF